MRWPTKNLIVVAVLGFAVAAGPAVGVESPAPPADPTESLRAAELAFADSMARRDHAAFVGFLDEEVVFYNGDSELRGPSTVADAWARFFETDEAPFSWRPEIVSVTDSGNLGLTSGPVLSADGSRIGTFNSVWRLGADGTWRIVFDRGCP